MYLSFTLKNTFIKSIFERKKAIKINETQARVFGAVILWI